MLNNTTFSSEIRNTLSLIAWKPLCEKCPNAELFLVRIFPYSVEYGKSPYSVWIPEITDEQKFRISTLFTHENISLMGDFNTPSENAKWYGLINPLSGNPTMAKHTQTNYLSVFGHFVNLALKGFQRSTNFGT